MVHRPLVLTAVAAALLGVAFYVNQPPAEIQPPYTVLASYTVEGNTINLVDGDSDEWHHVAWNRWVQLVPASARWRVGRFEVTEGDYDGQVEPFSDSLQVWTLRIAELDDDLLDVALVHELGHLISLEPGELQPATDGSVERNCTTYFSGEGCARDGSLVARFVDSFWDDELLALSPAERHGSNPSAFVSRYAATNPAEDIAETFVHFVYGLPPEKDTLADAKIDLLWDFPDVVDLRASLRRALV